MSNRSVLALTALARLLAAARGSMDGARSAVMDQMTSSGSAGDILYVDCNGG